MPRKQKKKAQAAEDEPEVEIVTKVEVIYEDTKATTRVEPDNKWGEVYKMISNQSVPEAGFEDMAIYANIERSAIMKVATKPELFPCSEVTSQILPRADITRMANTEKQGYAGYNPPYVSMAYNLPTPQTYLTESWLKELNLDMWKQLKNDDLR